MKRVFLVLPLLFCLTACWDYDEPSLQNYVLGMSIDYSEGKYRILTETVKITGEPTSLSASEGVIIRSEGDTLFEAMTAASHISGKPLYRGHMEIIILSEEVSKNHLYAVSDLISRSADIYSNVDLVVAKGCEAGDILTAKIPQDMMASVHIANILESEKNSNLFKRCPLWQLQKELPLAPIPAISLQDTPTIDGCAIIKRGSFQGYLNGDEMQIFTLVEDGAKGGTITRVKTELGVISAEILDVYKNANRLNITVSITNTSAHFDTNDPQIRKMIEDKIKDFLLRQIEMLSVKPLGNPLSYDAYTVNISLENSGLIKG